MLYKSGSLDTRIALPLTGGDGSMTGSREEASSVMRAISFSAQRSQLSMCVPVGHEAKHVRSDGSGCDSGVNETSVEAKLKLKLTFEALLYCEALSFTSRTSKRTQCCIKACLPTYTSSLHQHNITTPDTRSYSDPQL